MVLPCQGQSLCESDRGLSTAFRLQSYCCNSAIVGKFLKEEITKFRVRKEAICSYYSHATSVKVQLFLVGNE